MIHELHRWNRENLNHYLEVYLDVPIEELRRRDPKKIYERFFAGEITNVAGLDMEVEAPLAPHLHFVYDSNIETLDLAKQIVDAYLVKGGQISE
jgi:adenylylsulfate kinase